MSQKYKNALELKASIPAELLSVYEIETASILEDIKENGIMTPITLSKDNVALDGYRCLFGAIELGTLLDVPVRETDLETTVANRVSLNQKREKTWMDRRNELLISFQTFGKKQGEKTTAGYDRYVSIAQRLQYRHKDAKTLRQVEDILKTDATPFPLSQWLLERNADVTSVKGILERIQKEEFQAITKQVLEMKMSPKDALKKIKDEENLDKVKKTAFKLPEATSNSIVIFDDAEEEMMMHLQEEKVKAKVYFYQPDNCTLTQTDDNGKKYTNEKALEVYALKTAVKIKPYTQKRANNNSHYFVSVKEVYLNGIAQQLPSKVISAVQNETGLVYKQTLFTPNSDSLTEKKAGNNLPDSITQILWFVKFEKDRVNTNAFPIGKVDSDGDSTDIYLQCSNYINNQSLQDFIVNYKDKGTVADAASVIPIFLTTKENDLVVDISMKGDVAAAATIMNRKFVGNAEKNKLVVKASKNVLTAIDKYKPEMTSRLFGTATKKVAKVSTSKKEVVGQF
ncbi:MAG: hypothetical protein ACK55K_00990 [Bacteroidota bacterium]